MHFQYVTMVQEGSDNACDTRRDRWMADKAVVILEAPNDCSSILPIGILIALRLGGLRASVSEPNGRSEPDEQWRRRILRAVLRVCQMVFGTDFQSAAGKPPLRMNA